MTEPAGDDDSTDPSGDDDSVVTPTPGPETPTPLVDADGDGVPYGEDTDPNDPNLCSDEDADFCDDCVNGTQDPANDGPDLDEDGLCDEGDPDKDNDGSLLTSDCDDMDPSASPQHGYDPVGDGVDNDCDGDTDNAVDAGTASFSWSGTSKNGALGSNAQTVGDLNGDGFQDWVITEPFYGNSQGRIYLFLGNGNRIISDQDPVGSSDAQFVGSSEGVAAGRSLAVGDMDGDGKLDLAIGEPLYSPGVQSGRVAVLYGGTVRLSGEISLSRTSFDIVGDTADLAVGGAIALTDVNNDGLDDLVMGAPDSHGGFGGIYVFFGNDSRTTGTTLVSNIVTEVIGPRADSGAGSAVAPVGDMNGDGIDDVIIGAPETNSPTDDEKVGAIEIMYGSTSVGSLTTEPALYGTSAGEYAGGWIAMVGDLNGDKEQDIAIGAPMGSKGSEGTGIIYLTDYSGLMGANLTIEEGAYARILGTASEPGVGQRGTASGLGDVDGDGVGEILVGASRSDSETLEGTGKIVMFFGGAGLTGDISFLDGEVLWEGGQADGGLGFAGRAGDIDGDGHMDIFVSAPSYDVGQNENAGRTYLFFGF